MQIKYIHNIIVGVLFNYRYPMFYVFLCVMQWLKGLLLFKSGSFTDIVREHEGNNQILMITYPEEKCKIWMDRSVSQIRERESPQYHSEHTDFTEHARTKAITSPTDDHADFPADLNLCTWSVPIYLSPPTSLLFSWCVISDLFSV